MLGVVNKLIEMGVQASFVICIILIARFVFLKINVPKRLVYVLWAIPLFRLVCPFAITSDFSLMPSRLLGAGERMEQAFVNYVGAFPMEDPIGDSFVTESASEYQQAVTTLMNEGTLTNSGKYDYFPSSIYMKEPIEGVTTGVITEMISPNWFFMIIWISGLSALLAYSIISTIRLRKKLVGSVCIEKNYYRADHIETPFVLGVIRPKIYLPSSMPQEAMDMIVQHEEMHIRRKDHIVKLVIYIVTCVYWFNPFVWLMFVLCCRDMESAVDEKVVSKLDVVQRQSYATLLLALSTGHKHLISTPLAFGEGDVKGRIKNVVRYKKPLAVVIVIAILAIIVLAVGLMTSQRYPVPENTESEENHITENAEELTSVTPLGIDYTQNDDGTWQADGYDYKYRLILDGHWPSAVLGTVYTVLSNDPDITFEEAMWASGISSNMNDYFARDYAVIVEWQSYQLPPEGGLPTYAYIGYDPLMREICRYIVAVDLPTVSERGETQIPAPVIVKIDDSNPQDIKVWGNFWSYNYTLNGMTLTCEGGGEMPGIMHLAKTEDGYMVIGFEGVGDGSDYAKDMKALCKGHLGLYQKLLNTSDGKNEECVAIRKELIESYVNYYDLNVDSYQDYGWDPVYLNE